MSLRKTAWRVGRTLSAGIALLALPACGPPLDEVEFRARDAGAGKPSTYRAAVRGEEASRACQWPAVVGLDLGCSATLVNRELVVYAAHCGEGIREVYVGAEIDRPERILKTRHCTAHPNAALGNGFDVAFCLLAEPVDDIPPLRIAMGCELDRVTSGTSATVVGFGLDRQDGTSGVKRSAPVTLGTIAQDLVVASNATGTCTGDSGGPLLIETTPRSQVDAGEQRIIGVVSAANSAVCGPGTDHYSYLPTLVAWLESTSGVDLTPCFDAAGAWNPTALCTRTRSQRGAAACRNAASSPPTFSSTCGAAFSSEGSADWTPTELESRSHQASCSLATEPARSPSVGTAICALVWILLRVRRRRPRPLDPRT